MTECLNSSSTEHLVLFQSDWSAGVEALSITLSGCVSLIFKGSISVKRTCFKGALSPVLAPTLWNGLLADVPESQAPGWSHCLCDRDGESWSASWLQCYCGAHLHSRNHKETRKHLKFFFSFHLTPRTRWVTSRASSEHTSVNTTRCCATHAVLKQPKKMTVFKNLT